MSPHRHCPLSRFVVDGRIFSVCEWSSLCGSGVVSWEGNSSSKDLDPSNPTCVALFGQEQHHPGGVMDPLGNAGVHARFLLPGLIPGIIVRDEGHPPETFEHAEIEPVVSPSPRPPGLFPAFPGA